MSCPYWNYSTFFVVPRAVCGAPWTASAATLTRLAPNVHARSPGMQHDFDMIVIGSGPSGRRAAVQSAKLGKSVLGVEKGRRVGGVSVHTGAIPAKTLRATVLNLSG